MPTSLPPSLRAAQPPFPFPSAPLSRPAGTFRIPRNHMLMADVFAVRGPGTLGVI